MSKKLAFLVNDLSFFYSHRLPIAQAALNENYKVILGYGELGGLNPDILVRMGIKVCFVPIKRGGMNLINEIRSIYYIWRFLVEEKPDILHLVTIKPYIYGGILAQLIGIPALVSAVSGLGSLFITNNLKIKLLRIFLYPLFFFAFRHKNQVIILQNHEDANTLSKWGVLKSNKIKIIKGSGINIDNFTHTDELSGPPIVCFVGRLIIDKGIREFISAADKLKKKGINAKFYLAGKLDQKNFSGLSEFDFKNLIAGRGVEFVGYQKNIHSFLSKCHIVCLPSYREGFPKLLMEAAAAGRAVVTTDVPGCRDAIIPNKTGLLIPVRNDESLANALEDLIINKNKRIKMGKAGRILAEKQFKIDYIVDSTINLYKSLTMGPK